MQCRILGSNCSQTGTNKSSMQWTDQTLSVSSWSQLGFVKLKGKNVPKLLHWAYLCEFYA